MRFLGMEVNCGCEARRMAIKKWWGELTNQKRGNVLGKTFEKDGYLYTLDAQGDVIKEVEITKQMRTALDAGKE